MRSAFYKAFLVVFLFGFFLESKSQVFNEWRWKNTITTGAWEVNTNWEVWNGSAWVSNSSATYPSTNTQSVTVDLSGVSARTITVNNSVSNLSMLTIINNSPTSPYFTINTLNTLGVVGSFSVGGATSNSITIHCSTPVNWPYGGSYQQYDGGGFIAFRPVASTTLIPVFNNVKFVNVGLVAAGIGAVSITENNLSPQSFSHNSGNFYLNGNTINCKNSFNIEPIPVSTTGFSDILGSTINAANLTLASTANFSFQAHTTNVFLTDNMLFGSCAYRFKGNQSCPVTATLNSITFNSIGGISTDNFGASNKVVTNTINTSKSLWVGGGVSNIFRIKNFNLTQPLSIVLTSDYSPQITDIQSITTAPNACPAAYNFIGDLHGAIRSQISLGVPAITVNNMNFHNILVATGTITTTNAVDMGFNTGVVFSTPISPALIGATALTWNGSISDDWFNPANWTPNTCIPSILHNVIIPAGMPNYPRLEQPAFCYNFTSTGPSTVSVKPNTLPSLTIGGNFIRSASTNFNSYSGDIFLAGIKPVTNYNITSSSNTFSPMRLYLNADTSSTYNLTDSLTIDYPGVGNLTGIYHLSGGLKSNGHTINTNVLSIYGNAPFYRKFDITGSRINILTYNLFTSMVVDCQTTVKFKADGSRLFFDLSNTQTSSSTILYFANLPANNNAFKLHRVAIRNHPTRVPVITFASPGTNNSIGAGLHIDSLEANGNLQIYSTNMGDNLIDIDTLIVRKGYMLTGARNNSITINNKIFSNSDCTGAFTIKSDLPGTGTANNFYINTGGVPTYTLQNWSIDGVRVNQATAGVPAISVNNGFLTANTGTTSASGWNNTPAIAKTFFWIGEGATANWDDVNNWSHVIPTNGPDVVSGCLPGKDDNVYFTNMSFYGAAGGTSAVTSTVNVNINANFKNMFWQGPFTTTSTGTVALNPLMKNASAGLVVNGYGSIYMHKTMNWDFKGSVNLYSDTVSQLETQNNRFKENVYFKGNGKYTVVDSLYLSVFPAVTKGGIFHEGGELNLNGKKLEAKCYNSPSTGSRPIKFDITNSKVKFVQVGCSVGDFWFGNPAANTFTFISTNSQISIFPGSNYYAYSYDNGMFISSPTTLTFNVINISSSLPGGSNTDYGLNIIDKGIMVDSLSFDVNTTNIGHSVSTATNVINYLKYKLGSTNNITAGVTISLKELNSQSTCDPIIIQSSIPGSYVKICPSSSTPLQAQETSLKYINSACGSFLSPLYSQTTGGQSAFTPAGAQNTNGWAISNANVSLGFVNGTPASTVVNCNAPVYTITTAGFNISPSFTYTWSAPSGTLAGTGATSYTSLTSGTYTLGVTYKAGCTVTDVFTLTINNNLSSSYIASSVTCNGLSNGSASISLTPTLNTSNYIYTVSPGNFTTSTPGNLSAGIYTYTITNPISPIDCSITNTLLITQPAILNAAIGSTTQPGCALANGQAVANASGGTAAYSYSWNAPSPGTTFTTTTATATNLAAGTNTLTVIDINGCTTQTIFTLTNPNAPPVAITATNVTCYNLNNGVAVASISTPGTYTYNWSNSASTSSVSNLSPGNYSVTVTDANNCMSVQSVTITQPAAPLTLSIQAVNAVNCKSQSTGSANVLANGGTPSYTYTWEPSGGNTPVLNNVSAGNYTLNVTDNNGCTAVTSLSITESDTLIVRITNSIQPTCDNYNGALTAEGSGGTPSYTYSWTTGETTNAIANINAGTYSVVLTDFLGCKAVATASFECKIELIIPTLVTPNNDGKNDIWFIKGLQNYPNASVKIFNRWGNLLFEEAPYSNKFDGYPNAGISLFGSTRIPPATYFFILDLGDGSKPINNYFELQD